MHLLRGRAWMGPEVTPVTDGRTRGSGKRRRGVRKGVCAVQSGRKLASLQQGGSSAHAHDQNWLSPSGPGFLGLRLLRTIDGGSVFAVK